MSLKKLKLNDRSGFKLNLLSNLNYYGNLKGSEYSKPVKKIVSSVNYEEIKCVSYHPKRRELRATVHIHSQTGYMGDHCQHGSHEFVRFYIDYENNGNWEDLGVSSFKIHDIEDHKGLCYGVKLKFKPKVTRICDVTPVIPNVRAILSWNYVPPANTPNFTPVWGNVVEARIQIAPKKLLIFNSGLEAPYLHEDILKLSKTTNALLSKKASKVNLLKLKETYKKEVKPARLASMVLNSVDGKFNKKSILSLKNKFDFSEIDFSKVLEELKFPQFNTTYEELKCVALNRKHDELHADIQIKKSVGYSGDLCSNGSKEYVAFYMDFGSGWQFMGTSFVKVYDIDQVPAGGIWYNAYLPVNLTPHQKQYCDEGRAKIRGILSWNTLPTPNNPNYVATWGDWEECESEIKPLPKGVTTQSNQPWIESLGGVDTDIIDSVSGFADGPSNMGNSIIADYSPFDGNVYLTGKIINQTMGGTRYKVMIKEPGGSFVPYQSNFNVLVTTYNSNLGTSWSANQLQVPTGDYYDYIPTLPGVITKHVNDDILAIIKPTEIGLHEVYVESYTGEVSETVRFMLDKDVPEVEIEITTGAGNCGKFSVGDIIEGTFKVDNDRHLDYVRLSLAPNNPTGNIQTTGINSSDTTVSAGSLRITLDDQDSDLDYVTGTWRIDTGNLSACGYTIHIRAEDRTILNSSTVGKYSAGVSKGFCLE